MKRIWWFLLLMFALIALMVKASVWQWQRAADKQRLLDEYQLASKQNSSWEQVQRHGPTRFQSVDIRAAQAVGPFIYLDNQIQHGQVGYDVYQVFATNYSPVLVRLGWVAAGSNRAQLPMPPSMLGFPATLRLRERSQALMLDEQYWLERFDQGLRVQSLNIPRIAEQLDMALPGYFLDTQLDFDPEQLVSISPAKHKGYAVQWALMALTAVLLSSVFLRRSRFLRGMK